MMFDIAVPAPEGALSLQRIGAALGAAGVGLEGGGMWSGTAHYLVADGHAAKRELAAAGLGPIVVGPVLLADLDADVSGALGRMMQRLHDAGVVLHAQYSDHDNRKVLVVDRIDVAAAALGAG